MGKGIKIKLNRKNIKEEILKGDKTLEYLTEIGQGIADSASASAGEGAFACEVGTRGKNRSHVHVGAETEEGYRAEATDKALTKAFMGYRHK